jgi:hypothetical protein
MHSTRVENSASFKATAVNAHDAANAKSDVDKQILTSGIQFSRKDIEKMLSQGDKTEEEYMNMLREQYKHLYGEYPPNEWKASDIKKAILNGITPGTDEFQRRVEKGQTHGLSM